MPATVAPDCITTAPLPDELSGDMAFENQISLIQQIATHLAGNDGVSAGFDDQSAR